MAFEKFNNLDLNLLSDTINLMNKTDDFQLISKIIFKFIENFLPYDMAVIYKINEREKILEIVACIGSDADRMKKRMAFRIGEGVVGLVAKDKKAVLIKDALSSKEIKVRQYINEDPLIRSFLAVPLIVGDKLIGILSVSSSKSYQYDKNDLKMINIIASQGAVLLELNNNITEAQNFSNQILENINSGVIVINDSYEIITFNKAAENIVGLGREKVIGKKINNLPFKEKVHYRFIIESMEKGEIFYEEPGYILRSDGNYVRIRLSTSLIYDENNILKSCICIFRDTTEIEKLQKQIAMAEKLAALGRITSGITHEIRNPLLPIRNASQHLLENYQDLEDGQVVKLLKIIQEESERLNRFLQQLISLNRDTLFTIGECNLSEILEKTLILLNYDIVKNNIKLKLDISSKNIKIPLNEDNLKQVFLNIILNSIDALALNEKDMPRKIHIKVEREKYGSTIEIKDTGIGISKGKLTKIFEPFYTSKDEGTGIGLPIIHNIVTSCGGKISVESQLGKGTKVFIWLPLA